MQATTKQRDYAKTLALRAGYDSVGTALTAMDQEAGKRRYRHPLGLDKAEMTVFIDWLLTQQRR